MKLAAEVEWGKARLRELARAEGWAAYPPQLRAAGCSLPPSTRAGPANFFKGRRVIRISGFDEEAKRLLRRCLCNYYLKYNHLKM